VGGGERRTPRSERRNGLTTTAKGLTRRPAPTPGRSARPQRDAGAGHAGHAELMASFGILVVAISPKLLHDSQRFDPPLGRERSGGASGAGFPLPTSFHGKSKRQPLPSFRHGVARSRWPVAPRRLCGGSRRRSKTGLPAAETWVDSFLVG